MLKKKRLNKKAMEMAISTLIVIILAVLLLVVLALGFTTGWSSLWNKITPYIGGSSGNNVDSMKNACELLCNSASVSGSSKTEYCNVNQTLVIGKEKFKGTCDNLKSQIGLACDVTCAS